MPLTGKQLIDKAVLASGGKQITEGQALQHIIGNRQSTHIKEAEDSVFNSTVLLHKLYKTRLEIEKPKILEEIRKYIETLREPARKETLMALSQVEKYSINKEGKPAPYGRLESQRGLSLTTMDILVLSWIGATDSNAVENVTLTPKDIEDRKLSVVNAMLKANNEYGPNDPSCYGGMFHALIYSLSGVHRCVEIVLDKHLASVDVKTRFKHIVKSFFDVEQFSDEFDADEPSDEKKEMPAEKKDIPRSEEEKESILRAWGRDEPYNAKAEEFIEETKKRIKKYLLKRYNNIIPQEEIDTLLSTIEYLARVDLINPNIHVQIAKKALAIFNALPDKTKQQIFEAWDNENKNENSSADDFISNVMQEFLLAPEFESSRGFLDLTELENIQRSIIQLKKTDFGIVMESSIDEDHALKSHPNWFSNRKANTLVQVAKEYTQAHYGNVLKKLLQMVSGEAVAEAAVEPDNYGNNALMYAAEKQDVENFLALVNKLFETPNGKKAILQAMTQINKNGFNVFMLVAQNKKECLIDFINKILTIEGGEETLLASMKQVTPLKLYNVAMFIAQYQTSTNFIFFINKIFSIDERGPAAMIESMQTRHFSLSPLQKENLLMVTAKYQTQGGLIALLDKLESTRGGKKALIQSLITTDGIVKNNQGYHPLMFAARYQTAGGLTALSKKIVSLDKGVLFLDLIKQMNDESQSMKDGNPYVHNYNTLMFVMRNQANEDAIAFLDLLMSLNNGPQTVLKLVDNVGTFVGSIAVQASAQRDYNVLMLAAQFQTGDGFIALITKLSRMPGGPEAILKAMQQIGYPSNNPFVETKLLPLAANYQTPENFMIFINLILNLNIEKKPSLFGSVATLWGGGPKDMKALLMASLQEIVKVAKFASLVGLIRVCAQHDIDVFPSIIQAITTKDFPHRLTDVECVLIANRDVSLFSKDLSALSGSEMKEPAEDREIKIHLPEDTVHEVERALGDEPIDMIVQAKLLENFSLLKPAGVETTTASESDKLKGELKSKMSALQTALNAEDPAMSQYYIIQHVFIQVRAVVEEKEGKQEDIHSLFNLEEDVKKYLTESTEKHKPQLLTSSHSPESIVEPPLTLELMPPVIKEVLELINHFKNKQSTLRVQK